MLRKMQFLCGRKQQDKKIYHIHLKKRKRERDRETVEMFFSFLLTMMLNALQFYSLKMHNSVPLTGKKHNDYVKCERCGRDEPRAHYECLLVFTAVKIGC